MFDFLMKNKIRQYLMKRMETKKKVLISQMTH